MRPLLTSFLSRIGLDNSKDRSINHMGGRGTIGAWKPGCSRSIELISDHKKSTIRGEFEELGDEEYQWSAQRIDEDEGKGDQVPLHVIKVVTSIEQF
jgi:hypothetical protein